MQVGTYPQSSLVSGIDPSESTIKAVKNIPVKSTLSASAQASSARWNGEDVCFIEDKRISTLAIKLYEAFSEYSGGKKGLLAKFRSGAQ